VTTQSLHKIGAVAGRVGLSLRTVRYYEEQGLVRPAQRTDGGFRLYSEEQIARLELIKQMKPLGFSVREMNQLLAARDRLGSGEPDGAGYERDLDSLGGYAEVTEQKIEVLREQLVSAESFTSQLRRELRRHRRRAIASARS